MTKIYLTKMVISIEKNDVVWNDDRSHPIERAGFDSKEKCPISMMVALGATWYQLIPTDVFSTMTTSQWSNLS